MTRYMLDTNTVSQLLKGHANVVQRVQSVAMTALCISVVTEAELKYGLAKRPLAKKLHVLVGEFLKRVDILPWDSSAAEVYGRIRTQAESVGKSLGSLDMLIAAHGLSINATIVTNDNAFGYVEGLMLEDWVDS